MPCTACSEVFSGTLTCCTACGAKFRGCLAPCETSNHDKSPASKGRTGCGSFLWNRFHRRIRCRAFFRAYIGRDQSGANPKSLYFPSFTSFTDHFVTVTPLAVRVLTGSWIRNRATEIRMLGPCLSTTGTLTLQSPASILFWDKYIWYEMKGDKVSPLKRGWEWLNGPDSIP